mgnify:CR=1 FL=1
MRITGTSKYQSNNYTFTNLEIPVVFKGDPNNIGIIAVTTGKMSVLRQFFDNNSDIQKDFPNLYLQLSSSSYDNDCMFMIADRSASLNYSIHTVLGNSAGQCGKCVAGLESLMPNIRYFTEFNVTKLEYKVIEDADIKPTDYKLNFD